MSTQTHPAALASTRISTQPQLAVFDSGQPFAGGVPSGVPTSSSGVTAAEPRRLNPDPLSSKARPRKTDVLSKLCERYDTTLESSNLIVCTGRKTVHVLRVGAITSPACFSNEVPTGSYDEGKGTSKDAPAMTPYPSWNSVMIPDGWKVAVVVAENLWTAEMRIHNDQPAYRFIRVNEDGSEDEEDGASAWCDTPGAAFKNICQRFSDADMSRHNGKLYIGCHYEHTQGKLRDFFGAILKSNNTDLIRPEVKDVVIKWLDNEMLDIVPKKTNKRSNATGAEPGSSRKRGRKLEQTTSSKTATARVEESSSNTDIPFDPSFAEEWIWDFLFWKSDDDTIPPTEEDEEKPPMCDDTRSAPTIRVQSIVSAPAVTTMTPSEAMKRIRSQHRTTVFPNEVEITESEENLRTHLMTIKSDLVSFEDLCKFVKLASLSIKHRGFSNTWVETICSVAFPDMNMISLVGFMAFVGQIEQRVASMHQGDVQSASTALDSERVDSFVKGQKKRLDHCQDLFPALSLMMKQIITSLMPPTAAMRMVWQSLYLHPFLKTRAGRLFPGGSFSVTTHSPEWTTSNADARKTMLKSWPQTPLRFQEVWEFVLIAATKFKQWFLSRSHTFAIFSRVRHQPGREEVVTMEDFIDFIKQVEEYVSSKVFGPPASKPMGFSPAVVSFADEQMQSRLREDLLTLKTVVSHQAFLTMVTLLPSSEDLSNEWQAICKPNKKGFLDAIFSEGSPPQ